MMAAGILDLPQVIGGGIYDYVTRQPVIAPAVAQPRMPPELGGMPSGAQPATPPSAQPQPSQAPFFGRQVENLYKALGLPEPQSENEQTAAAITEALSSTVGSMGLGALGAVGRYAPKLAQALKARPIQQLVGTAAGAGAGEAARRGGGGSGAQFAAALLGSLGAPATMSVVGGGARGVKAAFTSPSQIAARQLAASSSSPATLAARLRAAAPSGLGAPQTTAMAAMDPGLAVLEKAIRGTPGGKGIRDVEALRAKAVSDTLRKMHPGTGMTTEQRGNAIRSNLEAHDDVMKQRVDQLYTAARGTGGTYNISGMGPKLAAIERKYYGPGGAATPGVFQRISQQILARGGKATNEFLINADQQLGNAANMAANAGDRTAAAALRETQQALHAIHGSPELQAAKAARARQGSVMGRDAGGSATVGQIVHRVSGRPVLTGEQVAAKAASTRAGVQQILDAGDEAIRAARAAGASPAKISAAIALQAHTKTLLREQFLDNAERGARATGNQVSINPITGQAVSHPEYTSAAWRRFWAKNDATARLLFSPSEHRDLQAITQQLADDATVRTMASAQGSHTAQHAAHLVGGNATVANIINAASRGSRVGGSAAAHVLEEMPAIVAGVAGLAFGGMEHGAGGAFLAHHIGAPLIHGWMANRNALVQAVLQEALANPDRARQLLAAGNAANFAKMLHASKASNGPLWGLIRRMVPAVASTETGATSYLPPTPQIATGR